MLDFKNCVNFEKNNSNAPVYNMNQKIGMY